MKFSSGPMLPSGLIVYCVSKSSDLTTLLKCALMYINSLLSWCSDVTFLGSTAAPIDLHHIQINCYLSLYSIPWFSSATIAIQSSCQLVHNLSSRLDDYENSIINKKWKMPVSTINHFLKNYISHNKKLSQFHVLPSYKPTHLHKLRH